MVKAYFIQRDVMRVIILVLAALLFAGCASQTSAPDQTTPYMRGVSQASADYYLQQMRQSHRAVRTNWQLLAIRALLSEGKTQQAQALYQQLPEQLTPAQQTERTLSEVQLKLAAKDFTAASQLLATLKPDALTAFDQRRYWQAQIDASQGVPSLTLLRALIAEQPLLPAADQQKNIDATWQVLSQMTPAQANALVINASEYTLQGWLDLQHAWFATRSDPDLLQDSIKNWQIRYPQNPAAKMLPSALLPSATPAGAAPQKIALLLPLNGQGAVFGATIEQGFEMAKNTGTSPVVMPVADSVSDGQNASDALSSDAKRALAIMAGDEPQPPTDHRDGDGQVGVTVSVSSSAGAPVTPPSIPATTTDSEADNTVPAVTAPDDEAITATPPDTTAQQASASALLAGSIAANTDAQIKVYDTTAQPMATLMAQVQQDGADIVVGPLLKENVAALQTINTPLHILALNQPATSVTSQPNICYFALSPDDETRDAAEHIWQQGQRQPLLLVPRGAFGNRVSQVFASAWRQLGGGTVLQQTFDSISDLKQQINHNIGIRLTGTPVEPAESAPQPVIVSQETTPPGAVDAVYIVADQAQLALIKPMITMSTGSRSKVAFYASSRSMQGNQEVDYRFEMEGLQFSEIPMLAGGNPALMQQALNAVQGDYSLARLYAMGVDAWTLVNNFNRLRQQPGFTVDGNTGQITADQNCVIHRKLVWLKYQQGKIVPVPAAE